MCIRDSFNGSSYRTISTKSPSALPVVPITRMARGAWCRRMASASLIAESLLKLDLPPMAMLILILGIIFVLGWPLEWVPIVLIVVPILLPLVQKLGIDIVWFCTLVAVCLQTAWLSPPVALSAYFLKGVVPEWEIGDIYKGMLQFMGLQLFGLVMIIIFPQIALWLPQYIYGK